MEDKVNTMLANENILLSNNLVKLQVLQEQATCNQTKLKETFFELLELYLKLRYNHCPPNHIIEEKYMWVEKSGVLD